MGPNQIQKVLQSKGNHKQNEKPTLGIGENICRRSTNKELISKTYKQPIQFNIKKIDNPIKKWAEDPHGHFSKEDIHMANKNTWKDAQHY